MPDQFFHLNWTKHRLKISNPARDSNIERYRFHSSHKFPADEGHAPAE